MENKPKRKANQMDRKTRELHPLAKPLPLSSTSFAANDALVAKLVRPVDQCTAGQWTSSCGRVSISMSEDMWYDCSQQGRDAEPFIDAYWQDSDHYRVDDGTPAQIADVVAEHGCTVYADPDMTIKQLLWIAACDLREETFSSEGQ